MTATEPIPPAAEPIITAADIVAGHDGQAEISVHVRYPNGAVRDISFPHEAIGPVLEKQKMVFIFLCIHLKEGWYMKLWRQY